MFIKSCNDLLPAKFATFPSKHSDLHWKSEARSWMLCTPLFSCDKHQTPCILTASGSQLHYLQTCPNDFYIHTLTITLLCSRKLHGRVKLWRRAPLPWFQSSGSAQDIPKFYFTSIFSFSHLSVTYCIIEFPLSSILLPLTVHNLPYFHATFSPRSCICFGWELKQTALNILDGGKLAVGVTSSLTCCMRADFNPNAKIHPPPPFFFLQFQIQPMHELCNACTIIHLLKCTWIILCSVLTFGHISGKTK